MLKIEVNKHNVDAHIEGEGKGPIVKAELIMANVALTDVYSDSFDIPFENAAFEIMTQTIAAHRYIDKGDNQ